jgi:hypothetical protein
MPVQSDDKPQIKLELQADGLRASWGPAFGPWGIFKEGSPPVKVEIKRWYLMVGKPMNPNKPDDEKSDWEMFSGYVGTAQEKFFPLTEKPKLVLAQVIGFFDSQNENGEPFEEGIYSNVARQVIH